MNNEQQELVYRAYDYYLTYLDDNQIFINSLDIDLFVKSCKKDSEDAKMWGLTFEERELTTSEIWSYIHNNKIEIKHQHAVLSGHPIGSELRKQFIPVLKENYNIPTKLITITYNDKTIENYE
jgi:hypothetical protein